MLLILLLLLETFSWCEPGNRNIRSYSLKKSMFFIFSSVISLNMITRLLFHQYYMGVHFMIRNTSYIFWLAKMKDQPNITLVMLKLKFINLVGHFMAGHGVCYYRANPVSQQAVCLTLCLIFH